MFWNKKPKVEEKPKKRFDAEVDFAAINAVCFKMLYDGYGYYAIIGYKTANGELKSWDLYVTEQEYERLLAKFRDYLANKSIS